MELGNGWGWPKAILRKLRLLEYLADWNQPSAIPNLPEWASPGAREHEDAIGDLEDFQARGWLTFEQDYGGGASIQFNGTGRAYVEQVRHLRADKMQRRKAARDAVLHWVSDRDLDGISSPNIAQFTDSNFGLFYGAPFPDRDIDAATLWLREKGYITGQSALGAGVIRPAITAEGSTIVESGRSVNDAAPLAPVSVTVTGSSNTVIQAASPGATQNVTIADDHRQQALHLADLLEQALPVLQDELPDEAAEVPGEIRNATKTDDEHALTAALRNASTAFSAAVGSALGSTVVAQIHALLRAMGKL